MTFIKIECEIGSVNLEHEGSKACVHIQSLQSAAEPRPAPSGVICLDPRLTDVLALAKPYNLEIRTVSRTPTTPGLPTATGYITKLDSIHGWSAVEIRTHEAKDGLTLDETCPADLSAPYPADLIAAFWLKPSEVKGLAYGENVSVVLTAPRTNDEELNR